MPEVCDGPAGASRGCPSRGGSRAGSAGRTAFRCPWGCRGLLRRRVAVAARRLLTRGLLDAEI